MNDCNCTMVQTRVRIPWWYYEVRSHGKCTDRLPPPRYHPSNRGRKTDRSVWLAIYRGGESDQRVNNWPRHGLLLFLMAVSPPGERQRGCKQVHRRHRRRGRGVWGVGRDPAPPGLPPDALPRRLQGRRPPAPAPAPRQPTIPPHLVFPILLPPHSILDPGSVLVVVTAARVADRRRLRGGDRRRTHKLAGAARCARAVQGQGWCGGFPGSRLPA